MPPRGTRMVVSLSRYPSRPHRQRGWARWWSPKIARGAGRLYTTQVNSLPFHSLVKGLSDRLGITSFVGKAEEWWFDTTRSVETCGKVKAFGTSKTVGEVRDSLTYIPVRVANARAALRELPISNYSQYTFIDVGSGKGRLLFVAAEFPFRKAQGVEFVIDLHEQACDNIRRYNCRRNKCAQIESINANAAEFEFPDEPLVICLNNPFGPEVLSRMLANLKRSIERRPRNVIVLLIFPKLAPLIREMPAMQLYKQTRRHCIYQTQKTR
jgi:SAM-dependent methyltransferase